MTNKTSVQLKAELTNLFYGIDPRTLFVDSVTVTRGGLLTLYRSGKPPSAYRIRAGKPAYAEIVRVFGLTDLVAVSPTGYHAGGPDHPAMTALKLVALDRQTRRTADGPLEVPDG